MNRSCTRVEFLQAGLGLLAVAVGCGDDTGSGGTGGNGTGGIAEGGNPDTGGGGAGDGGTPSSGGGGSTPAAGGGGAGPGACAAAITALISDNAAGHELIVPLADIEAAVDKTYDASGIASHCHEVTLTSADFVVLQNGGTVTKKSCNGNTLHEFTLSCGTPPQPSPPDCSGTPQLGACN